MVPKGKFLEEIFPPLKNGIPVGSPKLILERGERRKTQKRKKEIKVN